MPAEVIIYTTKTCPYCVRAKALLAKRAISFKEVDIGDDDAQWEWLAKATGRQTVPQIFIGGEPVGGCDDIHELDRRGELARRVNAG